MLYATLLSIVAAVAACVFAITNFRRGKRLKLRVKELQSASDLAMLELRGEIESLKTDTGRLLKAEEERQSSQPDHTQWHQIRTEVDHLLGEAKNLAILPTWHPSRIALAEELRPRLVPISDKLDAVLFPNQVAFDELDWMYKLPDRKFPYSLTFEEGMVIHHLVASNALTSGYEIATAFGFSSFFIATAFEKTGGHLISADAYIEEEMEDFIYDHASTKAHVERLRNLQASKRHDQLPRGLQFAMEGAASISIEPFVDYRIACSPEGVPELLGDRQLDFAFIDGGHFGEQPVLDVQSVLPFLRPDKFLMMFHDTQCEAVAKAVHFAAESTGTKPFSIHTRNRIVAVSKGLDPATLESCREMTVRQAI